AVNLKVLELPVASFLGEVTAQPRVSDLDRLFNQYKDKEPAPRASRPGFKSPQRAAFAFFSVKDDAPYFRERARAFVLAQRLQQLIYPMSVLGTQAGGVFALPGLEFSVLKDSRELPTSLQAAYFNYENSQKNLRWDTLGQFGSPIVRDSHLFRPETLATAVAQ